MTKFIRTVSENAYAVEQNQADIRGQAGVAKALNEPDEGNPTNMVPQPNSNDSSVDDIYL